MLLNENFFYFNGKHYLQNHYNGHKDSSFDSFPNIFMAYIETTILSKTVFRKCYIHDIFSLWDMRKPDIEAFIEQANLHHPTIKFMAETFDTEMQRF